MSMLKRENFRPARDQFPLHTRKLKDNTQLRFDSTVALAEH